MEIDETVKKIIEKYEQLMKNDPQITALYNMVEGGTATYKQAERFAGISGDYIGKIMLESLIEAYPAGNIPEAAAIALIPPPLQRNYVFVSGMSEQVQVLLNQNAEIGLAPVVPDFNVDRAVGLAKEAAGKEDFAQFSEKFLRQVENASISIVDDTVRQNAQAHTFAGLEAKVIRVYDGRGLHNGKDPCDFCLSREGEFGYREAIEREVFRRHPGCHCEISYITGKSTQIQTNWEHNQWTEWQSGDILDIRRKTGMEDKFDAAAFGRKIERYLPGSSRDVYEIAKSGGKNAGTYRQADQKPKNALEKSIRSHLKEADEHTIKISSPEIFMRKENPNDKQARQRAVDIWESHRVRNTAQAAIEMEVWKRKYG